MSLIKIETSKNRLEYLDSLRGLASISVVLSHFILAYGIDNQFKIINFSPLHFFYDGFAAVTLFFILSGYVLTLSLERKKKINLQSFYVKRIFRIMPSYLVALLLSYIAYSFFEVRKASPMPISWFLNFWNKPFETFDLFRQAVFLNPENKAELIPQNWSLKVEMQYSFIIPFLYLVYKKSGDKFFIVLNLVLYFVLNISILLLLFSLGMYLALNQEKIIWLFLTVKKRFKYFLILLLLFLYTYRYTLPMYYYYYFREHSLLLNNIDVLWLVTGCGAFLILVYCISSLKLQKILCWKVFTFIGRVSYAIYLTHWAVLALLIPVYITLLNNNNIHNIYTIWASSIIVLISITLLISYLVTILVETPMVEMGNSILNKKDKLRKMQSS